MQTQESAVAEKTASAELLEEIYRGVKMGSEAILTLLPKTKNQSLKNELSPELAAFADFAARAAAGLSDLGAVAKEENWVTKWSAKMGMSMHTILDTTPTHLAELLIQGNTMGITDLLSALHKAEKEGADRASLALAREVLTYEEQAQDRVKQYL